MTAEYIINIPDECFPISDTEHDRYYPDERHSPMPLSEIVRCVDCRAMRTKYGNTGIECWMSGEPFTVEPDGYCAWGARIEP